MIVACVFRLSCVRNAPVLGQRIPALTMRCTRKDETLEPDIYHMGTIAQQPWFKFAVTLLPRQLTYYAAYFAKSYPLDMSQYPRLFGTTRIAKSGRDELRTTETRHMAVMCGGRVYSVDVLTAQGRPVAQEMLEKQLRAIYTQAPSSDALTPGDFERLHLFCGCYVSSSLTCSFCVRAGVLTALGRDEWAAVRPAFVEPNSASVAALESALLVLALDHRPATDAATNSAVFLHSALDRWYDKSLQLIVAANGRAAVNFEHSWGDGVSVLRLCNEIVEHSAARPLPPATGAAAAASGAATALPLTLSAPVQSAGQAAAKWMAARNLLTAELRITGYGKRFFKGKKIAPDGAVQNAIQLAYRMAFGKTVATYESASTAGFKKGRTETIRPATVESGAFVRAMLDSTVDVATREKRLREAAEAHRQNSTNAAIGQVKPLSHCQRIGRVRLQFTE